MKVDIGAYLVLYNDPNYQGQCEEFAGLIKSENLIGSIIGNDTASSLKIRRAGGNCDNHGYVTVTTPFKGINHLQTYEDTVFCPAQYPHQDGFSNNSSPGVTAITLAGTNAKMLDIGFTNWNVTGDQVIGVRIHCKS